MSAEDFGRKAAMALFAARIAYGVALAVAPARVAGGKWLGDGAQAPAAQVSIRGIGAREVALHGAALAVAAQGGPLRPWLAASIAGDVADTVSTALGRAGLPDGSAGATAVVAGGAAVLSAAVLVAVDA